jgi:ArsR family transcriptional regulator
MSNYSRDPLVPMAGAFRALGSPQRLRILAALAGDCGTPSCDGPAASASGARRRVGEIAASLDLAPSTVSHHLKALREAGLMRVEKRGRTIECWVCRDAIGTVARFLAASGEPAGGRRR